MEVLERERTHPGMDAFVWVAEADGNRTRQTRMPGHTGFEDREGHQAPIRLHVAVAHTLADRRLACGE